MTTEAETRVMHLQAKEQQGLSPVARRTMEEMLPLSLKKEPTLLTPWFQRLSLRKCERTHFCVLSLWFVVSCVAVLENEHSTLLGKPT